KNSVDIFDETNIFSIQKFSPNQIDISNYNYDNVSAEKVKILDKEIIRTKCSDKSHCENTYYPLKIGGFYYVIKSKTGNASVLDDVFYSIRMK
ncbi:MAG: hypothetical protein Q7K55_05750, partial [Candidatus Levybacteria bacterium]|nr:hypothetical protein [Candidatus Levybacteria bacterium]